MVRSANHAKKRRRYPFLILDIFTFFCYVSHNMIVAIHQPQFMPWLGYFDKILKCDVFVFLDNVQFKKNEFQNRNKIKTAQGWMWLTVPVLFKFPQRINEVKINNRLQWRKKHLRGLEINYHKAPYFNDLFPRLKEFYSRESDLLADINKRSVVLLLEILEVKREIRLASQIGDLPEEPSERLAAICAAVGGDTYISGAGGKEYLKLEPFHSRGIKVIYQTFVHPIYPQLYGDFVPNLSLLDLILNCGPDSRKILEGKG